MRLFFFQIIEFEQDCWLCLFLIICLFIYFLMCFLSSSLISLHETSKSNNCVESLNLFHLGFFPDVLILCSKHIFSQLTFVSVFMETFNFSLDILYTQTLSSFICSAFSDFGYYIQTDMEQISHREKKKPFAVTVIAWQESAR